MPNEFVKAEYEPNFGSKKSSRRISYLIFLIGQLEKAPLMYSFGEGLQASKVANYDAEDKPGQGTSEEMGADESTLQESFQESENSLENNTAADLETAPVTKKKRKTNNNAVITEPAVQKKKPTKVSVLKKSKSESKGFHLDINVG